MLDLGFGALWSASQPGTRFSVQFHFFLGVFGRRDFAMVWGLARVLSLRYTSNQRSESGAQCQEKSFARLFWENLLLSVRL